MATFALLFAFQAIAAPGLCAIHDRNSTPTETSIGQSVKTPKSSSLAPSSIEIRIRSAPSCSIRSIHRRTRGEPSLGMSPATSLPVPGNTQSKSSCACSFMDPGPCSGMLRASRKPYPSIFVWPMRTASAVLAADAGRRDDTGGRPRGSRCQHRAAHPVQWRRRRCVRKRAPRRPADSGLGRDVAACRNLAVRALGKSPRPCGSRPSGQDSCRLFDRRLASLPTERGLGESCVSRLGNRMSGPHRGQGRRIGAATHRRSIPGAGTIALGSRCHESNLFVHLVDCRRSE